MSATYAKNPCFPGAGRRCKSVKQWTWMCICQHQLGLTANLAKQQICLQEEQTLFLWLCCPAPCAGTCHIFTPAVSCWQCHHHAQLKPLQMIQSARLIRVQPKRTLVTPLFMSTQQQHLSTWAPLSSLQPPSALCQWTVNLDSCCITPTTKNYCIKYLSRKSQQWIVLRLKILFGGVLATLVVFGCEGVFSLRAARCCSW